MEIKLEVYVDATERPALVVLAVPKKELSANAAFHLQN